MFIRQKKNKSGVISIQIIDKSSGKYVVRKTIGSSNKEAEINILLEKAKDYLKQSSGLLEFDFDGSTASIQNILTNITSHKLVGINLVLGKIFNDIGFDTIEDKLFKDLVLYRLVYPKSKFRTTYCCSGFRPFVCKEH